MTGHFWSLSIEEQFYLFWPATLLFLKPRRAMSVAVLMAFGLAAFRLASYRSMTMNHATQFHGDALLVGCAAAILKPQIVRRLRQWMIAPMCAVLVFCAATPHSIPPLYETAVVAILLIATSSFPTSWTSAVLSFRPLAYVGEVSYSLYLWNTLFLYRLDHHHGVGDILLSLAAIPAAALASYYLIEKPGRRLARLLQEHRLLVDQVKTASGPRSNEVTTAAGEHLDTRYGV